MSELSREKTRVFGVEIPYRFMAKSSWMPKNAYDVTGWRAKKRLCSHITHRAHRLRCWACFRAFVRRRRLMSSCRRDFTEPILIAIHHISHSAKCHSMLAMQCRPPSDILARIIRWANSVQQHRKKIYNIYSLMLMQPSEIGEWVTETGGSAQCTSNGSDNYIKKTKLSLNHENIIKQRGKSLYYGNREDMHVDRM